MPTSNMASRQAVVRFTATMAGLGQAGEALRALLDTVNIDPSRRYQVELALDEIVSNIIRHGQPVSAIELTAAIHREEAVLTFEDDGVAFDPRAHRKTRQPVSAEQMPIGGLGLTLVKSFVTRIEYERTPQHNRLTLAIPLR
jgi:anti-sigma regulatory factor (Ser/Thr protein kinase)